MFRYGQYCLQISKCTDSRCCSSHRSSLRRLCPTGFLPPPRVYDNRGTSIQLLDPGVAVPKGAHYADLQTIQTIGLGSSLLFDSYCPSVKKALNKRVCKVRFYLCITKSTRFVTVNKEIKLYKFLFKGSEVYLSF